MEPSTSTVNLTKVLIDFSAFVSKPAKGEKKPNVLIKELTIADIDSGCHQHWIFKPPKDSPHWTGSLTLDRHNGWISEHYHGLDFHLGFTEYESLTASLNYLSTQANLLYAPNREKAKILEDLFNVRRVVFDLEALGCPPPPKVKLFPGSVVAYDCAVNSADYDTVDGNEAAEDTEEPMFYSPCLYHQLYAPGFVCTRSNALHMVEWCSLNPSALDMNVAANREKTFDGWKLSKPSAKDIAESGFVRIGSTKDSTKCVYCGISLYLWEEGDVPDIDHEYNSPFCKLLRYRWQVKRKEEEANGLATTSNKSTQTNHSPDCACQPKKLTAAEEFYRRYGKCPDITLDDVYALCKA